MKHKSAPLEVDAKRPPSQFQEDDQEDRLNAAEPVKPFHDPFPQRLFVSAILVAIVASVTGAYWLILLWAVYMIVKACDLRMKK